VKKKMSAEDFLKNNRGINDGQDLPPEFMRSLYERIVSNEIQVRCSKGTLVLLAWWKLLGLCSMHTWDSTDRVMAGSMCSCWAHCWFLCGEWLVQPSGVGPDRCSCVVAGYPCARFLSSAWHAQIKDDLVDAASAKAAAEAAQRGNMLMNALWSIVGGGKQVRRPLFAARRLCIHNIICIPAVQSRGDGVCAIVIA
jgi:hypothetical protein